MKRRGAKRHMRNEFTAVIERDGKWFITVDPHNFDNPDLQRQFVGLFSTYHGIKDQTIDLYYLWIGERDAKNGFVDSVTKKPGDFTTNTLAARWP